MEREKIEDITPDSNPALEHRKEIKAGLEERSDFLSGITKEDENYLEKQFFNYGGFEEKIHLKNEVACITKYNYNRHKYEEILLNDNDLVREFLSWAEEKLYEKKYEPGIKNTHNIIEGKWVIREEKEKNEVIEKLKNFYEEFGGNYKNPEIYNIVKKFIAEKVNSKIMNKLGSDGLLGNLKDTVKKFNLSSSDIKHGLKDGLALWLVGFKGGIVERTKNIINEFNFSKEDIKEVVVNACDQICSKDYLHLDKIKYILDNFEIPHEELTSRQEFLLSYKKYLITSLQKKSFCFSDSERLEGELNDFSVSNKFLSDNEIQNEAMNLMVRLLDDGSIKNVGYASKIKNQFFLSIDAVEKYLTIKIIQEDWKSVLLLKSYFPELNTLYQDFLDDQKNIANDVTTLNFFDSFPERQKAFDVLAGLAENGESSITEEFSQIIKSRSKQKEVPESKWGLDPIQEAALYTLLRLDNPNSNEALFGLLFNENINETVKHAVFRKLIRKDRGFLNNENKEVLKQWAHSESGKDFDWQDLRFINAILNDIPSTETKNKSLQHIDGLSLATRLTQENDEETSKNINQLWQEKYNNIPENCFLQLCKFTQGDKELMDKFQILYTTIKKESAKKENLLYGTVNSLEINPAMLNLLVHKLKEVNFNTKQDADDLSNLLRRALFINSIEKISAHRNYEDGEYYEEEYPDDEDSHNKNKDSEVNQEIIDIFSRKITNIAELENLLKEVATKNIQKVLPNSEITVEKIEAVLDKWQGDLEPIFTYLSRFPHLKEYVAEIVTQIDTEENWQKWRYNLKNKTVKQQIGHLSEPQLKIWQENHIAELGDIMVAQSEINRPRHIRALLQDSIMQHKHIYNPEMGQNKNEFIQKTIENAYNQISKNPEQDSHIIDKEIDAIVSDIKQIDVIIKQSNIAKLRQVLEKNFAPDKETKFNAEMKNLLNFITSFLSKEMSADVVEYYRKNEEEKQKITANDILTQEIRNTLEKNILDIEEKAKKIIESSKIWEKFSLDKTNLKNLGPVYQKRQELKSIVDLLRLSNLSNKLIATNRISEKEGKKEAGETISTVLENLKKYFKDSPLLQDLQNVEFSLKEKQEFGEKRRLAMVFTDNPQILWQVGKYPLGCGSCQNYAEGSHASHLMGYVGDANCKAVYLVDLNKLPKDTKDKLEQNGFEQIKDNLTAAELLNISLARSIIKMTKDKDNKPVILLEPTYSSINKGDLTMDKYFNLFVDLMVAESMQAKMARGNGSESVSKGASRSPGDQYEDLDLSSVNFIHKLSRPTKDEEKIIERIRSSR